MSIFRSHNRNLAKLFLLNDQKENNLSDFDIPRFKLLFDITDFISTVDNVIEKIFNFENIFMHNVELLTSKNDIKFKLKYKPEFAQDPKELRIWEIIVKNGSDNFFKKMTNDRIRVNKIFNIKK
jgi:hypothetical protein